MKRVIVRSFIIFVVLAVIGQIAGFLASRYFGHDADPEDDEFRIVNIMGGSVLRSRAEALRTGNVNTVMGGTELDLREAKLAPGGAYLEVSTICGGTEILVPLDWRVEIVGTPQAGGHDLRVTDPDELPIDAPHLLLTRARSAVAWKCVRKRRPAASQWLRTEPTRTERPTPPRRTGRRT